MMNQGSLKIFLFCFKRRIMARRQVVDFEGLRALLSAKAA